MASVWTHGVWTVRPGREDDFVVAWKGLVPLGLGLGSGQPRLLRDRDRPNVFRSLGPWPDLQTVERFRAEIGPRMGAMSALLESFETFTLEEVYPGD